MDWIIAWSGRSQGFSGGAVPANSRLDVVLHSRLGLTGSGPTIVSTMSTFFTEPGCGGGYNGGSVQRTTDVQEVDNHWVRLSLVCHEAPAGALSAIVLVDNTVSGPEARRPRCWSTMRIDVWRGCRAIPCS